MPPQHGIDIRAISTVAEAHPETFLTVSGNCRQRQIIAEDTNSLMKATDTQDLFFAGWIPQNLTQRTYGIISVSGSQNLFKWAACIK
jgi:hypothetical protein